MTAHLRASRASHAWKQPLAFAAPVARGTRSHTPTLLVWLGVLLVTGVAGCGASRAPKAGTGATAADSGSAARARRARNGGTASVGSLSGRDIDNQRVSRVEELLQGRIAGVSVVRLGNGEYRVRVRGAGGFQPGSGEPLFVVDGMQLATNGFASVLSGIPPADVERIDVLKDAASLSMYGSQGANGVILITTRRPR
jgi:TonB-dependent SusC/RagA subfamily outer membrane receptor